MSHHFTRSLVLGAALLSLFVSAVRAQDAERELTAETWEAMLPVVSDYRAMLLEYNKNPGPDGPWFARATDLNLSRLPQGVTIKDKTAVESMRLIVKSMERMRGAHQVAREEAAQLFRHGDDLQPLQLTMLQAVAWSVAQAYDEWTAAHDRLAAILKDRKGYRLPRPAPPLLLRDLRDAAFPKTPAPFNLPASP